MKNNYIKNILSSKSRSFKQNFEDIYTYYFSVSRDYYYRNFEHIFISEKEKKLLIKWTQEQMKGKDLTLDFGFKWFFNNKIKLKKGVFIPQVDSEILVELVHNEVDNCNVLEIGTGTGALSIALYNLGKYQIDAIDINKKAIKLAQENFYLNKKNKNSKINFIIGDLFKYKFDKKYQVIFANPPYLNKNDHFISSWVKKNQPQKALYPKDNELLFYEFILDNKNKILKEDGKIFFEFGFNQKEKIEDLLKNKKIKNYKFYKDLDNNYRYLKIF